MQGAFKLLFLLFLLASLWYRHFQSFCGTSKKLAQQNFNFYHQSFAFFNIDQNMKVLPLRQKK